MPIEYQGAKAVLRGIATVEDAEGLLSWTQDLPAPEVDLSACTHIHPANLQVLVAADCRVTAWPRDAGLTRWLQSVLKTT